MNTTQNTIIAPINRGVGKLGRLGVGTGIGMDPSLTRCAARLMPMFSKGSSSLTANRWWASVERAHGHPWAADRPKCPLVSALARWRYWFHEGHRETKTLPKNGQQKSSRRGAPQLRILYSPSYRGRTIFSLLKGTTEIGRAEGDQMISIPHDSGLSKSHASIKVSETDGIVFLRDQQAERYDCP